MSLIKTKCGDLFFISKTNRVKKRINQDFLEHKENMKTTKNYGKLR